LTTEQSTLGEVFERLTKERGLRVVAAEGVLEIAGPPAAASPGPQVVDIPIDDLFAAEASGAETAAKLVRAFVAPDSWNTPGGGSLIAAPGKLVISQTPSNVAEAVLFLNRLRIARGKPVRAVEGVAAAAPPAETRIARARAILDRPVTMNFRPGAALGTVLAQIEGAAKVPIVVDYGALVAAGFSFDDPIGISARAHPAGDVLEALCRPRAWGWHLVRDSVIELTSLEAARSNMYYEMYDVRPLLGDLSTEAFSARVLDATSDLGWNETVGRAALGFDQPSGRLIVRQTQAGHLRLERLLGQWANPAGAAPAQVAPPLAAPAPAAPPRAGTTLAPTAGPTGTAPAPLAPPPMPTGIK